ncbi:MAG: hypothetical protein P8X86_15715 [Desulfofustis sp.]
MKREDIKLGIYEKALPANIDWATRLSMAEKLGFTHVELSVDETDERLARLEWTVAERKDFCQTVLDSPLTVPMRTPGAGTWKACRRVWKWQPGSR